MIVHVLFIVSLLISLLKGIDLFFSKKDKQDLQAFFDKLTLYIDDIQPQNFAINVSDVVGRVIITYGTYILGAIVYLYSISFKSFNEYQVYFLLYFVFLLFILNKLIVIILRFSLKSKNVFNGLIRLVLSITPLFMIWWVSMLRISNWDFAIYNQILKMNLVDRLMAYDYLIWFVIIGFPYMIIQNSLMWGFIFFTLLKLKTTHKVTAYILVYLKKLLWRVTTYEKGIIAGLTTLLTMVLGIVEIILKFYK